MLSSFALALFLSCVTASLAAVPDIPDKCLLPAQTGRCRAYFPRYYYNSEKGECIRFIYGGCGGNANNFETVEDCQSECAPMSVTTPAPPTCDQPKRMGTCKGFHLNYYYDTVLRSCAMFIYSGCKGNDNNFATLAECRSVCPADASTSATPTVVGLLPGGVLTVGAVPQGGAAVGTGIITQPGVNQVGAAVGTGEEVASTSSPQCSEPKKVGPCRARIGKYFFNSHSGRCERFYWGGCRPNGNNFDTLTDCREACM